MSEPLPGYTRREQALIALLVRYQRSGKPSVDGLGAWLRAEDGAVLERLAGILRLAVAFDRSGTSRVARLACDVTGGRLTILAHVSPSGVPKLSAPVAARETCVDIDTARGVTGLLRQTYGLDVSIEAAS
jgi:exopolyphosphatase/pppGpp-phosphohydrolase